MTDDAATAHDSIRHPVRLRQTPSWLIMQAATLTNRFVSAAYASVGATRHEYAILTALGEVEHATQAELGRHCQIDRSDIAGTIGELETAGWIERHENPRDRRQKLVTITVTGRDRLAVIAEALYRAQDELLDGLSADERDALSRTLVGVLDRHAD